MPENRIISTDLYRYDLPQSRIARYPLEHRDRSRLILYNRGKISHHGFSELPGLLPAGSWLVFNNTKVIQARLAFTKSSGARIEIFCLEPHDPPEHQLAYSATGQCIWHCLVGNAKKWKSGSVELLTRVEGREVKVRALIEERLQKDFLIRFEWELVELTFGEILESAGSTPIPPYLNRRAEKSDKERYQTVYSELHGSVAAPTAGLHFTRDMLTKLREKKITTRELTLHVGAGTFVPIRESNARQHVMHAEKVIVTTDFLEYWAGRTEGLTAVGTTSTRSLETLYWLGVKAKAGLLESPGSEVFRKSRILEFRQWENESLPQDLSLKESLEALIYFCRAREIEDLEFTTGLMISPGYRFRTIGGLITNFHQPGSTLLMLIAALIGNDWKKVYDQALEKGYRFLSYGDSSLLFPGRKD